MSYHIRIFSAALMEFDSRKRLGNLESQQSFSTLEFPLIFSYIMGESHQKHRQTFLFLHKPIDQNTNAAKKHGVV